MKKILLFLIANICLFSVNSFSAEQHQKQSKQVKLMQKTFGMIKPSGMSKAVEIKSIIGSYGIKILKSKRLLLTEKQFNLLYAEHKNKPFFNELKSSLVGKEVEVMILYGNNAVLRYRDAVDEIRSIYALNKTENILHGSDNYKRAQEEICIFFAC